uniref:Probable pectate lyase F n=1 Tax=Radopholus similis TaxID=46012 RepID=A0A6C0VVS3_RADSI|nr:pectate lyase 3 [Radopholus similis]
MESATSSQLKFVRAMAYYDAHCREGLYLKVLLLRVILVCGSCQQCLCDFWPTPVGSDISVAATIKVNASQAFDCKYARYVPDPDALGDGGQAERQQAVFELANKASLANCIIGAAAGTDGSADGVHSTGSCTLRNVWFENVGEDAATFYGTSSSSITYLVEGGGAKNAQDKVFQFNGMGTATINNFWVDNFTRFLRTCGNCAVQYKPRHVAINNLTALNGVAGQYIVGINFNYGETATLKSVKIGGAGAAKVAPCKRFVGVEGGGTSTSNGTGPDGTYCIYQNSDVTILS